MLETIQVWIENWGASPFIVGALMMLIKIIGIFILRLHRMQKEVLVVDS